MFKLFSGIFLALLIAMPAQSQAQVSSQKRFSNWVYFQTQYLNGDFSCQAYQCASGLCENSKSFLFNAGRGGWIAGPQFNHGFEYPPGTKVEMVIGQDTFSLENRREKNNRFFSAIDGRQALKINQLLLNLSKSKGSKNFYVVDRNGNKRKFSARGIDQLFAHFEQQCEVPLP